MSRLLLVTNSLLGSKDFRIRGVCEIIWVLGGLAVDMGFGCVMLCLSTKEIDMMYSIDRQTEANHNRRMANQSRAIDRMERLETKIERQCLIGELSSGKYYFYPAGGKYFEGTYYEVVDHIIKKGYVR